MEGLMRAQLVLSRTDMVKRFLVALCLMAVFCSQAFATYSSTEDTAWQDAEFAAEFDEEFDAQPASFPDPLESMNRAMLSFNQGLDRWVFNPITTAYRFVVPKPVRKSFVRFLINLDSPVVLANDLLQREWSDAGTTVGRFGINTTVGLVGLFDPASSFGLEGHNSDFGQTLAIEGVPSGAYIVLPVLGPTTVRDGLGDVVDLMFRPLTFVLGPGNTLLYSSIYGGSMGLVFMDAHADELRMLEESSVDFYAALRNAYYQNRTAEIWERRSDHQSITTVASEYLPEWSPEPELRAAAE
jgi:phospholipid-binding lipoprotein MlaA